MHEQDIAFEAEITEIGAPLDDWQGDGVHVLEESGKPFEALVAEMTEGDEDPFFVNLLVVREGIGNGKPRPKRYSARSVEDTARLLPGTLGYLGHQKPVNRDHEYRTPQMKIVKSRVDSVRDPKSGKVTRVARAKGYVSRRATDLRAHVREKMAGPISLQGRAVLVTRGESLEVKEMLSLRSIDFCNPGTQGIEEAGVESVVSEMSGANDGEGRPGAMSRMTKDQLQVEYGAEIREMIREGSEKAVDDARAPLETELAEMKEQAGTLEAEAAELRQKNGELKAALQEKEGEIAEIRKTNADLLEKETLRTLEGHRAKAIGKIAEEKALSAELQEMLARRVPVSVLDDDADLKRSKAAVDEAVGKAFEEVKEIAEMAGGSLAGRKNGGSAGGGNPPRRTAGSKNEELASVLLARGKKALLRTGSAAGDEDE